MFCPLVAPSHAPRRLSRWIFNCKWKDVRIWLMKKHTKKLTTVGVRCLNEDYIHQEKAQFILSKKKRMPTVGATAARTMLMGHDLIFSNFTPRLERTALPRMHNTAKQCPESVISTLVCHLIGAPRGGVIYLHVLLLTATTVILWKRAWGVLTTFFLSPWDFQPL